jgi:23S rRNA-/tRNA-specific pseudouridylate synthase
MRWIVGPADGVTLREVLARAGADLQAVAEGRVFVQRRRARHDAEPVSEGDEVVVAAPGAPSAPAPFLARTADIVAVDKPAGIPTIADHGGAAHALVQVVARAMGIDPSRLHPTSRLDRDVSGVVVFALTRLAARRLAQARSRGAYERRYVAIASSEPSPARGSWEVPIGRARDPRLRAAHGVDSVPARTRYASCGRAPRGAALLALAPQTGRTHQLRVHASNAGAPLLGDTAYGGPSRLTTPGGRVLEPRRIALHAARVVVPDEHDKPLLVTAPIPSSLGELWSNLEGDPAAWELATSCALV